MENSTSGSSAGANGAGDSSAAVSPSVNDHETSSGTTQEARSSNQPKSKPPADEDPDWDFGDGRKYKRSQVRQRLSEVQKGAQKANDERKSFEAKVKAYSERLQKFGLDPDEFEKDPDAVFERGAQSYLAKKLEEATLEPSEVEKRKLVAENEKYKKENDERTKAEADKAHKEQVDSHADTLAGHFATALKDHGLPTNPKAVWMMATLFQAAHRKGEQVSLQQLAQKTNELISGDLDHYLPEEDGSALAKRLGPKRTESLRKHLLNEAQSKFQPQSQPKRADTADVMTNPRQTNGYITFDEMLRGQRRR